LLVLAKIQILFFFLTNPRTLKPSLLFFCKLTTSISEAIDVQNQSILVDEQRLTFFFSLTSYIFVVTATFASSTAMVSSTLQL